MYFGLGKFNLYYFKAILFCILIRKHVQSNNLQ